jgi:hypothetical protein
MPKAKAAEAGGKGPDTCMLKMGKSNNVIQWREEMYNLCGLGTGGGWTDGLVKKCNASKR